MTMRVPFVIISILRATGTADAFLLPSHHPPTLLLQPSIPTSIFTSASTSTTVLWALDNSNQGNEEISSSRPSLPDFPSYGFDFDDIKPSKPRPPAEPNAYRALKPNSSNDIIITPNNENEDIDSNGDQVVENQNQKSSSSSSSSILVKDILEKFESIQKDILTKTKSATTTPGLSSKDAMNKLQLPEQIPVTPLLLVAATPLIALVSFRSNQAQRKKIEAEQAAAAEAKRLAKSSISSRIITKLKQRAEPVLQSVQEASRELPVIWKEQSSEVIDRTNKVISKLSNEVVMQLKERANVDVDQDTVGKATVVSSI